MSRTTTQIKDQLVRKGASEIIETMLTERVKFFKSQSDLYEWVEDRFDINMLGQSNDDDYDEVLELMMDEVHDRVYEFFNQVQQGILEKAFLVQKSLEHDTNL
jgi:hypothetical protein